MIPIQPLTEPAFAPYGTVLGKGLPTDPAIPAFASAPTDFWHEHAFDPGAGGAPEVVFVVYRNATLALRALEMHRLTEQAIVPLGDGGIVHVVARGRADAPDEPDLASLAAFRVEAGRGLCMRPRIWHASFVTGEPVTCLMLTRRSTTADLAGHLNQGTALRETRIVDLVATGRGPIAIA